MTSDLSDHDWRVEKISKGSSSNAAFKITDLETNESTEVDLSSFDFEHNSLIKMEAGSQIG